MYTRKMKELDNIVVPSFPGINQLVNYRMELAINLSTASGRYDCREIAWFEEIMALGKRLKNCQTPDSLVSFLWM